MFYEWSQHFLEGLKTDKEHRRELKNDVIKRNILFIYKVIIDKQINDK